MCWPCWRELRAQAKQPRTVVVTPVDAALLKSAISLCHPDRHPPERAATRPEHPAHSVARDSEAETRTKVCTSVERFGDELGDEPANEFLNGRAQLVTDERLERLVGRGHVASLRPSLSVDERRPLPIERVLAHV
jgi:hypothetical protein